MSIVDKASAKALTIWKKSRRHGWLDNYLMGNTRGKKASKEAFMAGYVMGVFHQSQESKYGQIFSEGHEQDASRNETGKVQSRNQPNLSGQTNKGEV